MPSSGNRGGRRGPPRTKRQPKPSDSKHEVVHLADAVVNELKSLARPGKGEILVKVFSDAAAAYAAEDWPEAIRLAEQAKHIALRSLAARELLGLAFYQSGQYKAAASELSAFRRISGTTEQNPVIADCYRALNRPDKALELCDEIDAETVSDPIFYEGAIVAAGALAEMGKLDEAIARLEALDLKPAVAQEHHLRAWYVLGDILERRGRFTQAREWFDAVAGSDPEITDAAERSERLQASSS